jgi:hypothetical protein
MIYRFVTCGCPIDTFGVHHLTGCLESTARAPERPTPPPRIGPGSRVRVVEDFRFTGGLRDGEVHTVERVEDKAGKILVFLVGDSRPWRIERFTAEL